MRVLPDPELTADEVRALRVIRDTDPRHSVRRRAQVILLAHKRYQGTHIAEILDMAPASVTVILKRWAHVRLACITRKRGKGRQPTLTEHHLKALEEWVRHYPADFGYTQTTWTCKLLTDCLKNQFNLDVSQERVRQVLHERGLSYKKPVLQPPTASPEQKKSAKRAFEAP
jgi:transposase